jgi:UDP-N-acetylglucosamine 2-epimerase (non-hydrolysing)
LTTLHFPPTQSAVENLRREGIDDTAMLVTGNTVIDALMAVVSQDRGGIDSLSSLGLDEGKRLILVTAHRRESFGEPLRRVFQTIAQIAGDYPDCHVVYPVHPNPNVKQAAEDLLGQIDNVSLISPLDYKPFVHLMKRAYLIITDSGGVQEEAPSLGVPVLVLREFTERPEAVTAGTVKLVGTDPALINSEVRLLLDDPNYYTQMANAVNPYGDGFASQRIGAELAHFFFDDPKPQAFAIPKQV